MLPNSLSRRIDNAAEVSAWYFGHFRKILMSPTDFVSNVIGTNVRLAESLVFYSLSCLIAVSLSAILLTLPPIEAPFQWENIVRRTICYGIGGLLWTFILMMATYIGLISTRAALNYPRLMVSLFFIVGLILVIEIPLITLIGLAIKISEPQNYDVLIGFLEFRINSLSADEIKNAWQGSVFPIGILLIYVMLPLEYVWIGSIWHYSIGIRYMSRIKGAMSFIIHFILRVTITIIIGIGLSVAIAAKEEDKQPSFAVFNMDSRDRDTLRVANYSKFYGCSNCWSAAVLAEPNDIVGFLIYYHNTSSVKAVDARVQIEIPTMPFSEAIVYGTVYANNTKHVAEGQVRIRITQEEKRRLIPMLGTMKWFPGQTNISQELPFGQTGAELFRNGGLKLGDVPPGWEGQGFLMFRARLSERFTK